MNSNVTCISNISEKAFSDPQWMMNYLVEQPSSKLLRLVVTPFDDLKDGFYRLCCGYPNMLCVSHIALIDLVNMFEEIYNGKFEELEIFIVGYLNFDVAFKNAVNQNPILETIDHLNSFIVTQKFSQLKKSLASALEFYVMAEDYARVMHDGFFDTQTYGKQVKERLKIYVINMEEEKEEIDG